MRPGRWSSLVLGDLIVFHPYFNTCTNLGFHRQKTIHFITIYWNFLAIISFAISSIMPGSLFLMAIPSLVLLIFMNIWQRMKFLRASKYRRPVRSSIWMAPSLFPDRLPSILVMYRWFTPLEDRRRIL